MTNIRPSRDLNPVPLSLEPQPDRVSYLGRPLYLRLPHTTRTVPNCLRRDNNPKQSVQCAHSQDYDFVYFRRVGSCRQDCAY